MKHLLAGAAAAAILAAGAAHAAPAIVSFSDGVPFDSFAGDNTIGFTFGVNSAITVNQLGWFGLDGNIDTAHQVGIWSDTGLLLGQGTVGTGAVDASGFRWVSVGPIALSAGQNYFIGGTDVTGDGDAYLTSVSNLVTAPQITFLGSAASGGPGFTFPDLINNTTTGGRFGPNFDFAAGGAVPEPATWAMMIAGFGGVGFSLRRRALAVA